MADFPETPHQSSFVEYVDEAMISRARSGAPKIRRLQTGAKRVFHVNLRGLTPARRDAVISCYNTFRGTTLTLAWSPTSETAINVMFGPDPIRWSQEGGWWSADVVLLEA